VRPAASNNPELAAAERPAPVFISHAHADHVEAEAIVAMLEANGVPCWIAPRDLPKVGLFADPLRDAINRCRLVLLVFSRNADESRGVGHELPMADEARKDILPVRISAYPPVRTKYFVAGFQLFDAFARPLETYAAELVDAIVNPRKTPLRVRIRRLRRGTLDVIPVASAAVLMTLLLQLFFDVTGTPILTGVAFWLVFAVFVVLAWMARRVWRNFRRGKEQGP
jgi:hypothetical protein